MQSLDTMTEGHAAQEELVGRVLDNVDVTRRLRAFPAIAEAYANVDFERHRETPPYYCHYLTWRLAQFRQPLLARLDALFTVAASLPGWERERESLVHDGEFGVFWSLIWQLQVAEFLVSRGLEVRWTGEGPDLLAHVGSTQLYVECLTLRKSYGVRIFIEELLQSIHPQLAVDHQPFLRFKTPQGRDELDGFLNELFRPFLDPGYLPDQLAQAEREYPILIAVPESAENLTVSLDGGPAAEYVPLRLPQGGGDHADHLNAMLREAVSNKAGANQLPDHRPNVLAVSLLLGQDPEVAISFGAKGVVDLADSIDELVYGAVGIDQQLQVEDLFRINESGRRASRGWDPGRADN